MSNDRKEVVVSMKNAKIQSPLSHHNSVANYFFRVFVGFRSLSLARKITPVEKGDFINGSIKLKYGQINFNAIS